MTTSVFLVYKTDVWHTHDSRDLIGIGTSHQTAVTIVKKQAEKEGAVINEDDIYNIVNISQTQSYSGDGEFLIEEIEVNTLL